MRPQFGPEDPSYTRGDYTNDFADAVYDAWDQGEGTATTYYRYSFKVNGAPQHDAQWHLAELGHVVNFYNLTIGCDVE